MFDSKNTNRLASFFLETEIKYARLKIETTTPLDEKFILIIEFKDIHCIQLIDINPYQNLLTSITRTSPDKFYDQFIDYLKPQEIINGNISPTNMLFSYNNKNEFIKTLKKLSLTCFSIESEWGVQGFIIAAHAKITTNKRVYSQ
jgi:hypothetical protein